MPIKQPQTKIISNWDKEPFLSLELTPSAHTPALPGTPAPVVPTSSLDVFCDEKVLPWAALSFPDW